MKKKLIIAITNRSSYNKVKTIIQNLPAHVETVLVLGNSLYFYKYGYACQNIREDFPDLRILKTSLAVEGDDLSKMPKTVGMGLIELSTLFENEDPDMILTVADRYETMATAIAAAYVNVPLVHLQGGEISGTIDDKVRNSITQLADFHFPATNDAADRVLQMKPKDHARIWNMGCPSMDLFMDRSLSVKDAQGQLNDHGVGDFIRLVDPYIIVMMHPDTTGENIDASRMEIVRKAVNFVPIQKIVFWNNIDSGGDVIAKAWRLEQQNDVNPDRVRYVRHLDPELFGRLLFGCSCIIGNSSAGIREATSLGTPSISLGSRQKGRECGDNVEWVPFDCPSITAKIYRQIESKYEPNYMYGDGHAGEKIARKIGELMWV